MERVGPAGHRASPQHLARLGLVRRLAGAVTATGVEALLARWRELGIGLVV